MAASASAPPPSSTVVSVSPLDDLLIVSVNHRTASADLRHRLYVDEEDQAARLAELAAAGVAPALLLCTCDRVEIATSRPAADPEALIARLADWGDTSPEALSDLVATRRGAAAVRHLFAVAASLDSQIVGEPQVLGQVKAAHKRAVAGGQFGGILERTLQAAYASAKRVRSETDIGERPVTLAASALQVARQIHGDLKRCRALLLGFGEMGELLAEELQLAGVAELAVTHPIERRAKRAAQRIGCHRRSWTELAPALAGADIVISAFGGSDYVLDRNHLAAALKARRRRPIFLVDAAIPGDVAPDAAELDDVFLYDLHDLEGLALRGKEEREAVAGAAWSILEGELGAFLRQYAERAAVPAVTALRERFESLRAEVLSSGPRDSDEATRLLVKRLLHGPSEALRQAAAEGRDTSELEALLARLFRLGTPENEDKT
ncbi:glutamyl-tRNA reductase [Algihabitans albus]|uniref:glutamyl-tRNA reductase n=1 Tax=Algihabitans albus TaxID=2164067 RepID=UPI000E5C6590|nr:glutamyl-tRNA reductase [Algihabitans albus]